MTCHSPSGICDQYTCVVEGKCAYQSTQDFWATSFGDKYHDRNRVQWRSRIPFWQSVIDKTGARSVYEVGCGSGWNLSAIKRAFPDVTVRGCEINPLAEARAQHAGLSIYRGEAHEILSKYDIGIYELVFTCGMLIHVSPKDLEKTMKAIVGASSDYVLCVEYHADTEEEVEYRGHSGKLWKRNYGKLYEDLGLKVIESVDKAEGFDNCLATLLRKP